MPQGWRLGQKTWVTRNIHVTQIFLRWLEERSGSHNCSLLIGNKPLSTQFGIYAYHKSALRRLPKLPPSKLEAAEKLEQLLFLANKIDICVADTPRDIIKSTPKKASLRWKRSCPRDSSDKCPQFALNPPIGS